MGGFVGEVHSRPLSKFEATEHTVYDLSEHAREDDLEYEIIQM